MKDYLIHWSPWVLLLLKLGQFLATRPDIIGEELSKKLENLQDKLPPFSINTS